MKKQARPGVVQGRPDAHRGRSRRRAFTSTSWATVSPTRSRSFSWTLHPWPACPSWQRGRPPGWSRRASRSRGRRTDFPRQPRLIRRRLNAVDRSHPVLLRDEAGASWRVARTRRAATRRRVGLLHRALGRAVVEDANGGGSFRFTPKLIALGLVHDAKARGAGWLLPDLKLDKHGTSTIAATSSRSPVSYCPARQSRTPFSRSIVTTALATAPPGARSNRKTCR